MKVAVRSSGDCITDLSMFVVVKLVVVSPEAAFIGGLSIHDMMRDLEGEQAAPVAFAFFVGPDAAARAADAFDRLAAVMIGGGTFADLSDLSNVPDAAALAAIGYREVMKNPIMEPESVAGPASGEQGPVAVMTDEQAASLRKAVQGMIAETQGETQ